jgi:signal recognition particle GTPase
MEIEQGDFNSAAMLLLAVLCCCLALAAASFSFIPTTHFPEQTALFQSRIHRKAAFEQQLRPQRRQQSRNHNALQQQAQQHRSQRPSSHRYTTITRRTTPRRSTSLLASNNNNFFDFIKARSSEGVAQPTITRRAPRRSTSLHASNNNFFDFIKTRSSEGIAQLSSLVNATLSNDIQGGFERAAEYTAATNAAIATSLAKSRNTLVAALGAALSSTNPLTSLEDALLMADLGVDTTDEILAELREVVSAANREGKEGKGSSSSSALQTDANANANANNGKSSSSTSASIASLDRSALNAVLRGVLIDALTTTATTTTSKKAEKPPSALPLPKKLSKKKGLKVILVIGANGMGKTTTIGKLAHRLKGEGEKESSRVLLAACDTYRAAAAEQLELWAERANVDIYLPPPSPSPSLPSLSLEEVAARKEAKDEELFRSNYINAASLEKEEEEEEDDDTEKSMLYQRGSQTSSSSSSNDEGRSSSLSSTSSTQAPRSLSLSPLKVLKSALALAIDEEYDTLIVDTCGR